jgi:hypothetical protein
LSSLSIEPLAYADLNVSSTEVADDQAQKMEPLSDIIRRSAGGRLVSPDAARRNTQQSREQLQPEYLAHSLPFELWCRRLLQRRVEVLEGLLKSRVGVRDGILLQSKLDSSSNSSALNVANKSLQRRQIERIDALVCRK